MKELNGRGKNLKLLKLLQGNSRIKWERDASSMLNLGLEVMCS